MASNAKIDLSKLYLFQKKKEYGIPPFLGGRYQQGNFPSNVHHIAHIMENSFKNWKKAQKRDEAIDVPHFLVGSFEKVTILGGLLIAVHVSGWSCCQRLPVLR